MNFLHFFESLIQQGWVRHLTLLVLPGKGAFSASEPLAATEAGSCCSQDQKRILVLVGALFLSTAASAANEADQIEFFEKRIRPILAQECYECHSKRHKVKAGLELDSRPGWEAGGDSGPSIIPGDPANSLLLATITHEHEDMQMPKAGAKLEESVLADFEKWIADGAFDPRDEPSSPEEVAADTEWSAISARRAQWWSFQPVTDPDIPTVEGVSHPVDQFLGSKRDEAGLEASPKADRWAVLRRLHYVLTGLPATNEEMNAFSHAWETLGRETAVAQKADELLASPHFGERWAQHWLDWFRYTEGHGGQGDPVNENATEFRDYMIRALNANVPYDQLIREHLAGDLLEKPRLDPTGTINESIIGLAQYRFVEHGFFPVDALDELVKFTDNQIDVVTKATMGLTVSCARCHDHKFDAISHNDFHALFGIFASSRPARRQILAPEIIDLHRAELQTLQDELATNLKAHWLASTEVKTIRERLDHFTVEHGKLEKNKAAPVETLAGKVEIPTHFLVQPADALEPWIRWENENIASEWNQWAGRIQKLESDARAHNQKVTVQTYDFREGIPEGWRVTDGTVTVVDAGALGLATDQEGAVKSILPAGILTHSATAHEQAALFSPDLTIDFDAFAADWSGSGWSMLRLVPENFPRGGGGLYRQVDARSNGETRWFGQETDFWNGRRGYFHLQTRGTASAPPAGHRGLDGKPMRTAPEPHGSWFHVREIRKLKSEDDRIRAVDYAASSVLSSGETTPENQDELAQRYTESIREILMRWLTPAFTDEDALFLTECLQKGILDGRFSNIGEASESTLAEIRKTESSFAAVARRSTPAVVESAGFDQPFYHRGNHHTPGDPVPRGFLEALDPKPFELGDETGRLELARHITSDDNPFFARIIANRLWHHTFGHGLVRTPDNFGRTGEKPTHRGLLDHLATRMRDGGYDLKGMIRYLVTSDLFQLSTEPSSEVRQIDPENRYWTHAELRRFDAEIVRDHLLSVSGVLDPKQFGPQIVPTLAAEKDRRRGVYLARKRKGRNAFLDTFDMPVPMTTRGKRDVTTTPSQAITMLNSPFVRYQAEQWANAHEKQPASDSISNLIRSAYSRLGTESEIATLIAFYVANGEGVEGLTEVAHLVFNSKEFIYLR